MIRRALIPTIAVCAALGVGVALGGGPLSNPSDARTTAAHATGKPHDDLAAQAEAGQRFATAVAPTLLDATLTGQRVAILAMPGTPDTVTDGLATQIAAAGGTVTSTVHVTTTATDPANKALIDTLGDQMATQVKGVVEAAQPPYVRLGQLLASAVATTGTAPAAPTSAQSTTLATLDESHLVATEAAASSTAPLLLIALGDHVDPTILAGIVEGGATRAHGIVVTGSTGSGLRGDLKRVRALDLGEQATKVATVDGEETSVGQITAVLALARQVTGGGGAYGASGIDGAAPLG